MAERSRGGASFSRGRLLVALVVVAFVAAGLAFAVSKLRSGPGAGRLVYAARQGLFERDLATGADRKIASLPTDVEAAMPSPDGRYVAYALGQGELWIAATDGDRRFQVAEQFTIPVGWSPDGRLVAGELLSDRDLVAVDPDGRREVLLSGGYASGALPVWIDEDRFAIQTDDASFALVESEQESSTHEGRPLVASADAAELLYVRDESVFVAKIADDGLEEERRVVRESAAYGAFGPEGFAAIATDDAVLVLEGGTQTEQVVDRAVDWVGWSNAGAVLLYAHDGVAYALDLSEADQKPKRVTREGADVFAVLAFAVLP